MPTPIFSKALRLFAVAAVLFSGVTQPARAGGTATVLQADGTQQIYAGVQAKIVHNALYLTSADGQGTLVINRAACSKQSALLVCLPTSVTLVQQGNPHGIDLSTGTIYLNLTDEPQQMVLSTTKVPPHSLVLSLSTKRGSYVSFSGTIDQIVK
jgi:hypothetical protein